MSQQVVGWQCYGNGAADDVMALGLLAMLPKRGGWRCYGIGAAGDVTATQWLPESWQWGSWVGRLVMLQQCGG